MKKANFLFGYAMKDGQIIVNEDEKIVVEKIYSDYLENFSAEHITESLNAIGVAYKSKRGWNKNIVYRILDDNRYLGVDGYPMIICREKWENVEKRRKANTTKYMDAGFQELRRKMVCARCGSALIRNKQKREAAWWQCKMCGAKKPTIDDMEITRLVFTKISGLEKHPEIINAGIDTASINIEAVRRQRDFERLLADHGVSTVELDELAKQITQLKYNDIDPENREYATKQILEALQAPLTGRDKENYLFRQAVFKVLALAGCSKGDVTKEVNSGLSDLKAQAAEPAVEPQTETPAEPKTDAASEPASEPAAEPEPEATAEPAPASAPADNPDYPSAAGLNTQMLEAFGTDFTLVLNVTCPDQGWYKSASTSFGDLKLFPTDDPSHIFSGDPRITFELKSGLDKINYYYDDFENVEELTPRTIGGVEMAGRTYKNVGMWWTEYYGEMPTGGWLAIKISGVDIDPGTEGDTVLNSITFG